MLSLVMRCDHRDHGLERGGERKRRTDSRTRLAQHELVATGAAGWRAHTHSKHQSNVVIRLSHIRLSRGTTPFGGRSCFNRGLGSSIGVRDTLDAEAHLICLRLVRWQAWQMTHHAIAARTGNLRKQAADGSLAKISAERRKACSERGGGCTCLVGWPSGLVVSDGDPAASIAHQRPGVGFLAIILPSGLVLERQDCNSLSRAQHAELNATCEKRLECHRLCVRLALDWRGHTAQTLELVALLTRKALTHTQICTEDTNDKF